MQNLSDEELDDRMKQAGEFQDYAYEEASWQNVKARLDRPADGELWITPTKIISTVALISVLLLGTWFYSTRDSAVSASEKEPENSKTQLLASIQTESVSPASTVLIPSGKTESVTKILQPNSPNEDVQQKTFVTKQNPLTSSNAVHQKKATKVFKQTESSYSTDKKNSKENSKTSILYSEKQHGEPIAVGEISAGSKNEVVVSIDSIQKEAAIVVELLQKDSLDVETEADENNRTRTGLWSVKLSLSPDWSAQSFSTTAALGFNYGLSLEYKITNAIGISAGILRTRKYYTAEDITYGRYTAEYAEGECNMWDIPIQINYYVPTSRSIQVFGSVGFSSYLMSKENYTYYPYADNKTIRYSSAVENRNKEWFKVLNLSVGLQRPLGKTVFVQVEPFVKVPLSEMGEGNIAISSIGLFLNLKYQLKK